VLGAAAIAAFYPEGSIFFLLTIYMFISLFSVGMGRGVTELYSHYIYMIPASPLRKILWSNAEMVFKVLVESTLVFVIAGVIMGDSLILIALSIAIYVLFCLVLLGVQYLLLRLTGSHVGAMIKLTVYMLALIVVLAPGVAAVLIAAWLFDGTAGMYAGLAIFAAWQLIAAVVCLALSKGVLHDCDMMVVDGVRIKN